MEGRGRRGGVLGLEWKEVDSESGLGGAGVGGRSEVMDESGVGSAPSTCGMGEWESLAMACSLAWRRGRDCVCGGWVVGGGRGCGCGWFALSVVRVS